MRTTRSIAFNNTREDGFTLTELLVVIVIVAILGLELLPALAGTKPNSQAFQCLENLRQLTLGWQMYAEDNNSKLARNGDQASTPTTPTDPSLQPGGAQYQWCPGNMAAFSPYQTALVQDSALYPYVLNTAPYHCPADNSYFPFGSVQIPHARSYSMNCYLAPINQWPSSGGMGTRNYYKETDLNQPGPAMTYVFIGESAFSINDGFFVSDPTMGYTYGDVFGYWQDVPAVRHGNACGLSYADGHSEIKRWKDVNVINYTGIPGHSISGDSSGDAKWLSSRATTYTGP